MNPIASKLADLVFPPFCVSCGEPDAWWCASCRKNVEPLPPGICPSCLANESHECQGHLPFTSVQAFGFYHDPCLRAAITALKFRGASALGLDLTNFLASQPSHPTFPSEAVIIPVPLTEHRLKERGFNQAEVIAQCLCEAFSLTNPIRTDLIERLTMHEAQSSLDHDPALRQKNVQGCFRSTSASTPTVLLVDDVATTGATAAEAAKELIKNSAQSVHLVVLAIGA